MHVGAPPFLGADAVSAHVMVSGQVQTEAAVAGGARAPPQLSLLGGTARSAKVNLGSPARRTGQFLQERDQGLPGRSCWEKQAVDAAGSRPVHQQKACRQQCPAPSAPYARKAVFTAAAETYGPARPPPGQPLQHLRP